MSERPAEGVVAAWLMGAPIPMRGRAGADPSAPKHHCCPYCTKQFRRKDHLTQHVRIHTGEKPYTCPYCPYSAAQKEKLKAHIRTHTGEKPFACEHCPYRSTRKDHLKSHVRLRHMRRTPPQSPLAI